MKKFTIMSLLVGILYCTSACHSGKNQEEESTDQNVAEDPTKVSPGQLNTAANEAPTTSTPEAGREAEVDNSDAAMKTSGANLSAEEFVQEAASGGMMEVELGTLASQKAKNAQVKEFGQMMVKDHTKANEQLKSIAAKKNMTLPAKMMDKHQQHVTHLSALSGEEFDREYMAMMVNDHQEDVSKFGQASKNVNDAQIKSFAGSALPVLQMHLEKAQQINNLVSGGSAKANNK